MATDKVFLLHQEKCCQKKIYMLSSLGLAPIGRISTLSNKSKGIIPISNFKNNNFLILDDM